MSDIGARLETIERKLRELMRYAQAEAAQNLTLAFNVPLDGATDGATYVYTMPMIDGAYRVPEPFNAFILAERGRTVISSLDYEYDGGRKVRMVGRPRAGPIMLAMMQYDANRVIVIESRTKRRVRRRMAGEPLRRRRR